MNRGLRVRVDARRRDIAASVLLTLAAVLLIGAWNPGGAAAQQSPASTTSSAPATVPEPNAESTTDATTDTSLDAATGPTVWAILEADGTPLEGIDMVVSANGTEVARATSDAAGNVRVTLDAGGEYQITLDASTFPAGIDFAADAQKELSPTLRAEGERRVAFKLTEGGAPSPGATDNADDSSSGSRVPGLLVSGIRFGLIIALGAVGLSVIFGTTNLTNFAHGELLTFGAMAAWYVNATVGGLGWPFFAAAVIAIAASTMFGLGFEYGVYRPLRRRNMPMFSQMVVSIGLAFAVRYVFAVVFGNSAKQYSQYAAQAPSIEFGPFTMRPKDLVIIVVAFIVLIGVGVFLSKSRMGTAIRAVSDNRDLAIASGIDHLKVTAVVWGMSGALAGLAGVMLGSSEGVSYLMGQRVLLVMFAAVLLGGLGTAFGAIVGGLFVGVVSDLSTLWLDSDLKVIVALGTLVLVLLTRPQGIFGVKARTA